jgi:hypothetical protein
MKTGGKEKGGMTLQYAKAGTRKSDDENGDF